ncbi:MAG: carboxypeptidase-like regulatory domain-containing protein [Planctomycetaceae bacterium]|nr:carboxypeptidase-like regulatory domain-containing protein [Planctomycetaceae bacterium]
MLKRFFIVYFSLQLIFVAGCSQNINVSGHVTFSDGEPVSFGSVVFETPKNCFSARLNDKGFYSVGDTKDGAGIPAGEYKIWLSGTDEEIKTGKNENDEIISKPRIHKKYTRPDSSGLTFEVKRGGEPNFDFKIERAK